MSTRNIIQTTIDDLAKAGGFFKKSGTWYRRQAETIAILDLQKSQYSHLYFLNVALWLLPIADAQFPKEPTCHVRSRLTRLFPNAEEEVNELLDLDAPLDDPVRCAGLRSIFSSRLLPLLDQCSTIVGLRSDEGRKLTNVSLVTGAAQQLLNAVPR